MAKNILIADDDKQICKVLHQYCTNMGCFDNIIVANDGAMAATKLKNQKFDVILMDVNMPKRTGVDVLNEIFIDKRALNLMTDVIIVSGTLDKTQIAKLASFGCKNFLIKPFDEKDFQEKVLKVLKKT